ncbi:uncharacterized protein BX663DRAFT_527813 [Cokeromyces recurvatus]|uniref:uncharacterized protein n=1 Tax=Cokeromyces recurvatus TaxID=90255 RepID=UPI00221F09B6|nr:uncharacterized protein BX663DRAFT_527813 [Cokeromyces recurvatus]KAI7897555.1 hypothetical protein BX663DRAFT_527813 [Cokeromyces recurvatus]
MQAAQTELEFINLYLESLSSKSVRFGDDYLSRNLPSPLRIKRVPSTPIIEENASQQANNNLTRSNDSKFQVTIKVLKPSLQFTIGGLSPNTTINQLKQRIYQQQSSLPIARQRLLIKGKVLADQKSLEELAVKQDTTIHLMLTAAPAPTTAPSVTGRFGGISAEAEEKLKSPEFWTAMEKTLVEQLGQVDATLILSKVKSTLSA